MKMVDLQPRSMGFTELVELLAKEHVEFNGKMIDIRERIRLADFAGALSELVAMKEGLYQHIVDEESSVLTLLIDNLGRKGAAEAIEIFQEHVDIQDMIENLEGLLSTGNTSIEQLGASLDSFMAEHFRKEDEKVFPKALKAGNAIAAFA